MRKYADNVGIVPVDNGYTSEKPNAAAISGGRRFAAAFVELLRRWHTRRRSRRALDRLTTTELRDIGISRHEARNEYRKSFFID